MPYFKKNLFCSAKRHRRQQNHRCIEAKFKEQCRAKRFFLHVTYRENVLILTKGKEIEVSSFLVTSKLAKFLCRKRKLGRS